MYILMLNLSAVFGEEKLLNCFEYHFSKQIKFNLLTFYFHCFALEAEISKTDTSQEHGLILNTKELKSDTLI